MANYKESGVDVEEGYRAVNTLLVTQTAVLFLAFLTVQREVNGNRGAAVEVGKYQLLNLVECITSICLTHFV